MESKKNIYRIFVASTLKLKEHRKALEPVIQELNVEFAKQGVSVAYEEFVYESSSDFSQKLEKFDAQEPVVQALHGSAIFFLIVDDCVAPLTESEFRIALGHHENGHLPQFMYVFHHEGDVEGEKESLVKGITYNELMRRFNLKDYYYNTNYRPETHYRVYGIPYHGDNERERVDSLAKQMKEQLRKLATCGELPPEGALRGKELMPKHFFGDDEQRLDNCPSVYYQRQADSDLREALQNQKTVVVTGPSLSGKTRAVMEALKEVDDGWVCLPGKEGNMATDLTKLSTYLSGNDPQKLYIVVDNLEQLSNNEAVKPALKLLIDELWKHRCKSVLVATASTTDIALNGFSKENFVRIDSMEDKDFDEIKLFFKSSGVTVESRNLRYHLMGALFVDLDKIWNEHYVDFLRAVDEPKEEYRLQAALLRQQMLMSIKGQSIWRDDHLGDVVLLRRMTHYFYSHHRKAKLEDEEVFNEMFDEALALLCEGGHMGWKMQDKEHVVVQEYVYRYFIGFDGLHQQSDSDQNNTDLEAEKGLIRQLVKFCHDEEAWLGETLTHQVSRLARRGDHNCEVCEWLYGLWSGTDEGDEKDKGLATLLRTERERVDAHAEQLKEDRIRHFYSDIQRTYIYRSGCGVERALEVYRRCPEPLRTDHLLSAVLRSAVTSDELEQVRALPDYKRFCQTPYMIFAEVEKTADYSEAHKYMERFSALAVDPAFAEADKESGIRYNVVQLKGAVSAMGTKVSTPEELDQYLDLLRRFYTLLVLDAKAYHQTEDPCESENCLTELDLLCILDLYTTRKCVEGAVGDNIEEASRLLKRLLDCVSDTLKGKYTTETHMRLTLSAIGSTLIKSVAKTGASYDEVHHALYGLLDIAHPTKEGVRMVLRNTYTYTNMMDCKDGDIFDAANLFENDLVRQVRDKNNPLYVNRYTLNTMLKMSIGNNRGKKKQYVENIARLFDLLNVKRDTYTYCLLFQTAERSEDCKSLLEQMKKEKVPVNQFILLDLQRNDTVSLRQALSFVGAKGLPQGCQPEDVGPDKEAIARQLAEMSEESRQEYLKLAWINIFDKPVHSDSDRQLLNSCLEYLERNSSEMLADGVLYNRVMANGRKSRYNGDGWLRTVKDASDFIDTHSLFHPDSYTASHLIEKVRDVKGRDKRMAVLILNNFFKKYPVSLNATVVNMRLQIYKEVQESLPMVFVQKDGTIQEEELSPTGYMERMLSLRIPVDSYSINTMMKYRGGRSESFCRTLMRVLVTEQDYYTFNRNDAKAIQEHLGAYVDAYPIRIERISRSQEAMIHNRQVAWNYKKQSKKTEKIFPPVDVALQDIDWLNHNSAVTAFNDIINCYINNCIRQRQHTPALFADAKGFYELYFCKGRTPSSYTFPILAKAATNMAEIGWVLEEYKRQKGNNPLLTLHPHMLGAISAQAQTMEELIQFTRSAQNNGCSTNRETAEVYVVRMVLNLLNTDPKATVPVLDALLTYIMEGGDKTQMLEEHGRKYLLLDQFANESQVSATVLSMLLLYNHRRLGGQRYSSDQLTNLIFTRYNQKVVELMNQLSERGNEALKQEYLPKFFFMLGPNEGARLSERVVKDLTSWPLLPKNNLEAYNRLMKQCYMLNVRSLEEALPRLNATLQSIDGRHIHSRRTLYAVRRTQAQIAVYAHQKRLRMGHLLVEKAPEKYADWCSEPIDHPLLREVLSEKYADALMADKVSHYLRLLHDGYTRSLEAINRAGYNKKHPVDDRSMERVRHMERWFSRQIERGEIPFVGLYKLPWLWYKAAWTPSEHLVLALVKRYAAIAGTEGEDSSEAREYIKKISDRLHRAQNHESHHTILYYNTLGRFPDTNTFTVSVSTAGLTATLHPTGKSSVHDRYLAEAINQGYVSYDMLVSLPTQWFSQKAKPGEEVLAAMIRRYQWLALSGCALAPEAIGYLSQLKQLLDKAKQLKRGLVRVRYNAVGEFPADNGFFCEMPVETLMTAMPHPYLTALVKAKLDGETTSTLDKGQMGILKKLDCSYAHVMDREECPFGMMMQLPQLWDAIGWIPSWQLVTSMAKRLRILADTNGPDSEPATVLILRLKKALENSKRKGKKDTLIPYAALSITLPETDSFVLVPMKNLEDALTQQWTGKPLM